MYIFVPLCTQLTINIDRRMIVCLSDLLCACCQDSVLYEHEDRHEVPLNHHCHLPSLPRTRHTSPTFHSLFLGFTTLLTLFTQPQERQSGEVQPGARSCAHCAPPACQPPGSRCASGATGGVGTRLM